MDSLPSRAQLALERRRVANKKYAATPKGKASKAARDARYAATPKGKASKAARDARYAATPKGRRVRSNANYRYNGSVKGYLRNRRATTNQRIMEYEAQR